MVSKSFSKIRESVEDNAKTTLGVIALREAFFILSLCSLADIPLRKEKVLGLIKELLRQ